MNKYTASWEASAIFEGGHCIEPSVQTHSGRSDLRKQKTFESMISCFLMDAKPLMNRVVSLQISDKWDILRNYFVFAIPIVPSMDKVEQICYRTFYEIDSD